MSALQPRAGGGLSPSGASRRAAKTINGNSLAGQVRASRSDTEADLTDVKIENSNMVTAKAMAGVVKVGKLQRDLELIAPETAGRLSMLADSHAFCLSDLLADDRRTQRRI